MKNLDIKEVYPNPSQPRKKFDQQKLQELADSIKANGLLQPITVVRNEKGYMIVAGERRFRAAQLAGETTIRALIENLSEKQIAKIAMLENVQREDMTACETAHGYQALLHSGCSLDEISKELGKSVREIKWYLYLVKLDPRLQEALDKGIINKYIGCELARVDTFEEQWSLFRKIREQNLNAQETSHIITAWIQQKNQGSLMEVPEVKTEQLRAKKRIENVLEEVGKALAKLDDEMDIIGEAPTLQVGAIQDNLDLISRSISSMNTRIRKARAISVLVAS